MNRIGEKKRTIANGYKQQYARCQATNCQKCPLRAACHRQKSNRIIEVTHKLNWLRSKAKERLLYEEGISIGNKGFKRVALRGLRKVEVEIGLIALAHNLAKVAAW